MLADICFLGQDFNLNLDGADFEPTGEGRNDVLLFTDTPEKEVDWFNLQDLDVSAILHMNDPVADILDWHQILRHSTFPVFVQRYFFCRWRRCLGTLPFIPLGLRLTAPPMVVWALDLDAQLLGGLMCDFCMSDIPNCFGGARLRRYVRPVKDSPVLQPSHPVDGKFSKGIAINANHSEYAERQRNQA